jgi:hypothetical protein
MKHRLLKARAPAEERDGQLTAVGMPGKDQGESLRWRPISDVRCVSKEDCGSIRVWCVGQSVHGLTEVVAGTTGIVDADQHDLSGSGADGNEAVLVAQYDDPLGAQDGNNPLGGGRGSCEVVVTKNGEGRCGFGKFDEEVGPGYPSALMDEVASQDNYVWLPVVRSGKSAE